jgi:acyl-CoA dehydrogenase
MDLSLNETQQMYVNTVSRFVKNEILPHALEMDRKHVFPVDLLKQVWDMGIMNISVPESIKGYHVDVVSAALIIRELSYGDSGLATSAMCNDLANVVIAQHGSEAQQQAYLKPFVDAPLLSAFCLTEQVRTTFP